HCTQLEGFGDLKIGMMRFSKTSCAVKSPSTARVGGSPAVRPERGCGTGLFSPFGDALSSPAKPIRTNVARAKLFAALDIESTSFEEWLIAAERPSSAAGPAATTSCLGKP